MRTTINISEDVLERVKRESEIRGTSVSELIERALVRQLDETKVTKRKPFRLVTVRGKGLHRGLTWENLSSQVDDLP